MSQDLSGQFGQCVTTGGMLAAGNGPQRERRGPELSAHPGPSAAYDDLSGGLDAAGEQIPNNFPYRPGEHGVPSGWKGEWDTFSVGGQPYRQVG
jgi:hypothetical protein